MKKFLIIFLIITGFGLASCKKFLDVNQTPNNPLQVPPSTLLPNTLIGMAFANANDLNRGASVLVQHIAGVANQSAAYDVFLLDGPFDNSWSLEIYNGCINNLQILIDQQSATSPAYSGVAKLQMAYVFSMATDLWGDIPYSQAGKGLQFESPRFDKQEDIYLGNANLGITSLFDLVKSGLADLDKPSVFKPGAKDDLVYKGDLAKWKKMGNTLLLKFAIQISKQEPNLAKTTIESVIAGNNFINSNDLDFEVPFGSGVGNRNPIFDFNNNFRTGDQMLSTRMLALAQSLNDTVRLAKFFTKTRPNGNTPFSFVGYNNGATTTVPTVALRSKYNAYLTGAIGGGDTAATNTGGAAPIRLLTNFQVKFILAEAALLLGTPGDANALYQEGIKANMQKIGMTIGEINQYFADNPNVVTLNGTNTDKQKQIITQKYIAWIGNGIEAFNDFRRTGFPELALPLNTQGDNPNVIPTRFVYTPNELARNPNAPKPRPKTDVKVWWAE